MSTQCALLLDELESQVTRAREPSSAGGDGSSPCDFEKIDDLHKPFRKLYTESLDDFTTIAWLDWQAVESCKRVSGTTEACESVSRIPSHAIYISRHLDPSGPLRGLLKACSEHLTDVERQLVRVKADEQGGFSSTSKQDPSTTTSKRNEAALMTRESRLSDVKSYLTQATNNLTIIQNWLKLAIKTKERVRENAFSRVAQSFARWEREHGEIEMYKLGTELAWYTSQVAALSVDIDGNNMKPSTQDEQTCWLENSNGVPYPVKENSVALWSRILETFPLEGSGIR